MFIELLSAAGVSVRDCLVVPVYSERPPQNDPKFFLDKKGNVKEEWQHEVERLRKILDSYNPVLTIAVGAVAMERLTGLKGITKYRGTVLESEWGKVIPTLDPLTIQRGQFQHRATVGKDLVKARIESGYRDFIRPQRELWIKPKVEDLYEFEKLYMPSELVCVDIETDPWTTKQILCIGFAPDPRHAIVVPFLDKTKEGWSYWDTLDEEMEAYFWCKRIVENNTIVGQNFLYDIQWLDRKFAIRVNPDLCEDTMLMHHAMQPELEKGLGYLASTYTNEVAFKNMVSWKQNKREA